MLRMRSVNGVYERNVYLSILLFHADKSDKFVLNIHSDGKIKWRR